MNKKSRLKNTSGSRSKKGVYNPINPDKYVGDVNDVVYMSSWELKFMIYCDNRSEIIRWGSEAFHIPYIMERKNQETGVIKKTNHKYWPDFYMEVLDPNSPGGVKKIVVEVKPSNETVQPVPPKKFSTKAMKNFEYAIVSFQKNMYKWERAKTFCEDRGMTFMIITEKHLGL